jgi:hypothetical protein
MREETELTEAQTCCTVMNNFYETLKETEAAKNNINGVILHTY